MTRRKLLWAVLVALLAAAAAWWYLARERVLPDAVTALLSRESPAPAPAPPAPARSGARPAAPPAADADARPGPQPAPASPPAGARAVPSHTVEGEIGGRRFHLDAASIESGTLRLRQLEPALALELVLPVNPWQVPAGRSFEVLAPEERVAETPLVRVHVPGREAARAYARRYTLWLEFGRERNGALPGRLHLVLPDAAGSRVAGTFVADIRGFRFIDGRPDLSADSTETLEYLALRAILRQGPDLALAELVFGPERLEPERAGAPASGYLELGYRARGEVVRHAFRFRKEDGAWRVREHRVLPQEGSTR